ncbi:DNA-formamidopyrimidine glycosylase family protein [Actinomadura keratinilytica]
MPEGDTVHQAAGRLHQALAGQELTVSDLRVPRLATVDLTGRTVLEVVARGKHLLTRLEGGLTLHSHLRMDGSWRIFAPGERWRGGPGHQIRAVLGTASRTAVGYRLPVLELLRTPAEDEAVGHLGPDLLGPDWSPPRRWPGWRPRRSGRSARPCWTSAIWRASATSSRANSASCSA